MGKVYKTAQGKAIDIDSLRLVNETTVAVGNMKVNARGDQLGAGGKIVQTRNQTMDQHYKLHTPMVNKTVNETIQRQTAAGAQVTQGKPVSVQVQAAPVAAEETVPTPEAQPEAAKPNLRGSLADSIAKQVTVQQELLTPLNKKPDGPTRI